MYAAKASGGVWVWVRGKERNGRKRSVLVDESRVSKHRRTQAQAGNTDTHTHTHASPRRLSISKTLVIAFPLRSVPIHHLLPSCAPLHPPLARLEHHQPVLPSVHSSVLIIRTTATWLSSHNVARKVVPSHSSLHSDEDDDDGVRESRVTTVLDWTPSRW
jgi:hypothetical protein